MSLTRINKTGRPKVIAASDRRLTITVPIQIKRRSGRKLLTLPSGAEMPRDSDPTPLQLALARGHRWLALLESGEVKSLREIARKEGVDSSYVSRMVNLTTLAPDIAAAILDETLLAELKLFDLAVEPPAVWEEQREHIGMSLEHIYAHLAPNEVSEEAVEVLNRLQVNPVDGLSTNVIGGMMNPNPMRSTTSSIARTCEAGDRTDLPACERGPDGRRGSEALK